MRTTNEMINHEQEIINAMLENSYVEVVRMNNRWYLVIHYTDGREHWTAGMSKSEIYDFMDEMEYTLHIVDNGNIRINKEGK